MSAIQSILVFGATGSQGGATITVQPISPPSCNRTDISIFQALAKLNSPIQKYKILAVTRNVASDKAKALASLPGIEVVLWDPSSSAALFEMNKVDGMFLVLDAFQADETGQGESKPIWLHSVVNDGYGRSRTDRSGNQAWRSIRRLFRCGLLRPGLNASPPVILPSI